MDEKKYKEYSYLEKADYDKQVKINGDNLGVYSKKKFKEICSSENCRVLGETYEGRKRNKLADIGRIELNEKWLYVGENGKHCKLFKTQGGFAEVADGGYIALLKTCILPIILIIAIILGCASFGVVSLVNSGSESGGQEISQQEQEEKKDNNKDKDKEGSKTDTEEEDPGIKPVTPDVLTLSGVITIGDTPLEGVVLTLQNGNTVIATAETDKTGKYLFNNVANGDYNLVCTYNGSVLTKKAFIDGLQSVVDFDFKSYAAIDTSVKAIVKITDENTPAISVDGLSAEAEGSIIVGQEVDLTLLATKLLEDSVPQNAQTAIEKISGELEMTYFDFSVLKEIYKNSVLTSSEYLKNTSKVLEIAVPFNSERSVATYAFRFHNGEALKMEALSEKPTENYKDGTFYATASMVYIYTNCFSTYAIGAANTANVVRGSDTITYSNQATVNLKTEEVTLLYKHDADSTNNARVELYLVGSNSNVLIAESGIIPVGYQIESLQLISGIANMPSVGTYEGLMKIIYLGSDGSTSTNVDIPLTVAIVK